MRPYKAQGLVLHSVKYGDSSLIVYLYTNTHGRVTYMIHGARSKGALFQPMFILEFEGSESHGDMHRMKDISTAVTLSSLPFDIRKSTISLFMAELVYRLIREREVDEHLFNFILNSVIALDAMENGIANFHLWFLVKLSYFLGFYPGNHYFTGYYFDIRGGEFVAHAPSHRMYFTQDQASLLGSLMECQVDRLGELPLSRKERVEFLNTLLIFISYHSDSINSVRSIDILKEVF